VLQQYFEFCFTGERPSFSKDGSCLWSPELDGVSRAEDLPLWGSYERESGWDADVPHGGSLDHCLCGEGVSDVALLLEVNRI